MSRARGTAGLLKLYRALLQILQHKCLCRWVGKGRFGLPQITVEQQVGAIIRSASSLDSTSP